MIYGLIGSSGTGKTTLAKLVAEDLDLTYMPSSITECARKHGFNSVGDLDLQQRMKLQWHLLEDHVKMIEETPRPAITDRTPIDMVGYCMAEFWMHSHTAASQELLGEARKYVSDCLRATERHYDYVFHLGQLAVYEVNAKRPAANPAYERHTDLIMKGCLMDLRQDVAYSVIASHDLQFRQDFVSRVIVQRLNALEDGRRSSAHIH